MNFTFFLLIGLIEQKKKKKKRLIWRIEKKNEKYKRNEMKWNQEAISSPSLFCFVFKAIYFIKPNYFYYFFSSSSSSSH